MLATLIFFEVSSFFCHCRYICDIISELCHSPEVIVSPNSVTVDWMDKKKIIINHSLVSNCQIASPENRNLLIGTFAFYFLP